MRAIATLCLFACTVFLPALASGASRSPDLGAAVIGTIKVGGAFSLTGDGAALDQEAADGARLAVTEINRTGKLLGKNVEIVLRDSQSRPEMAEQVARQLAEKDRVVAILGYSDTDSALAARYVVQEHRIPFIAVGATSPRLPAEGGEMMFLACFGDNVQAAAGAEFAFGHFGPNACLLWDEGMDYTRLLAGYFKRRFIELGGTILDDEAFKDDTVDFTPLVQQVQSLPIQPDFFYIAAMPYNAGRVIRQLREAGLKCPIMGGDGYDTPELLKTAGSAAEGVFFTTHAFVNSTEGKEDMKRFITAFVAEYGREPQNAFAALGYDAMRLLLDAIRRAGSTDPSSIKHALEETKDFPGITGDITLSPKSHIPRKSVTIIEVKEGKFRFAGELVPQLVPSP